MQISSRFTIALHSLICIHTFDGAHKITSDFIAESVNVNPVIIRNVLGQLKKAGLVEVQRGAGGAHIVPELSEFTLYDVFIAVDSIQDDLFAFHDNPNPNCPVGKQVHTVLDGYLDNVQNAMINELKKTTFEDVVQKVEI
ncbi:Rrf2 family transcriptional regulator [Erysipelothrix anatis]|uniref:Rrf2 family transcriptional regulator n=1 Tax=Erysipelothrix anatis TaxID=2683713 RepID=UPI00135A0AAE|nr:Rrf2 family transcriptional regulator [Erysipelothrix anatis]